MKSRVLIVDDDPEVSECLKEMINDATSCCAETAHNPFDGLAMLAATPFNIVFSDLIMPEMNGIDFLRHAKQINPAVSVVIITGYPTVDVAVQALKEGAFDFIQKPFQHEKVKDLINEIIARQQNHVGHETINNKPLFTKRKTNMLPEISPELSLLHAMNESFYNNQGVHDVRSLYHLIVQTACLIGGNDYAFLFVYDREQHEFIPSASWGMPLDMCDAISAPLALKLVHEREYALVDGTAHALWGPIKMRSGGQVNIGIILPIVIQKQLYAMLYVGKYTDSKSFSMEEILLLINLARKSSLSIENKLLSQSIYTDVQNMLNTLVAVIGARDHYTLTHSMRVTEYALSIGKALGCDKEELDMLNFVGHLHDIGKIGISDTILLKSSSLTRHEYKIIQQHPIIGEHILKPLGYLPRERDIIRYHHERWDGKGYPDGLEGEDIPLLSRILAIADSFDAMTTDRPYRKSLSVQTALKELQCKNDQFDKNIVAVFMNMITKQLS
ncbi:MAG: response regulator [Desulfobacterota bacterium]|nr:response regulator [Thermodesulfobacteriota bacterium]